MRNHVVNLHLSSQLLRSVFLFLFVICFTSFGLSAPKLSERAEIGIVTFGPYQEELYSAFGHSGIHIYDPIRNLDLLYDYGRFDFEQENFYWNFARGKMMYSLGRSQSFTRFVEYYSQEDRYIHEQILNLTLEEKQSFFDFLEENYKKENRNYLYNYVFDNCASRIRDVVKSQIKDSLVLDLSYKVPDKTVRDLMKDYLAYQPWGDFIINVSLAHPIDKESPAEVYMFLPDYIEKALAGAKIWRKEKGIPIPLVKETRVHYEQQSDWKKPGWFTPFNFFLLVFFFVGFMTNRNFRKGKKSRWLDRLVFSVVGFLGCWLVFLWFGTVHLSQYNWNILWAIPFHLPFIWLTGTKKYIPFLVRYFRFTAILNLLLLVGWFFVPQPLHFGIIPLLLLLILRSAFLSFELDKEA